jgi:hypothetical protein
MNILEIQKIAYAWIAMNNAEQGSKNYKEHFWAWEKLDELCRHNPEDAWLVIDALSKIDSSDKMLANIAAGPLEDVLVWHGDKLINKIEETAKDDSILRKLLGGVWKNEISDNVWNRLKKISGKPL